MKFAAEWIRLLSLLVIQLRSRLSDLTLKSPKARIASYILLLAEMQDSRSITFPVPRKELATFLGMTHETFYRSTRELVKEGMVRFAGQTIEILDQDLLAEIIERRFNPRPHAPELPGGLNRVLADLRVRRQDGEPVGEGLADEHPVKRVLVVLGKPSEREHGVLIERQRRDVVQLPLPRHETVGRLGEREAAQRVLHHDFPRGDGA